MEKEKFELRTMDYVTGAMGTDRQRKFEKFLQENPGYQKQVDTLHETWERFNQVPGPEPSREMDERFFGMLHDEVQKNNAVEFPLRRSYWAFLETLSRPQWAFGLVLLGIGLGLGYVLNSGSSDDALSTAIVHTEDNEQVREQLVLALLEQPSANKRLQGIGEANKIANVDEKVIQALLETLNNDPNVNVRLAAIASLTNYADNPTVREAMVMSIVKQNAPIVQVTLANLMVALQEKKSIKSFETLMRTTTLDASVKQKFETSIQALL